MAHTFGGGQFSVLFHAAERSISYLHGYRSIHNIRIERLWRDYTLGLGWKWKDIFQYLEAYAGLQPDEPGHIWLLHFLFLPVINDEIQLWAEAWNSHVVSIAGHRHQSPRERFVIGSLQHGIRGQDILSVEPPSDNLDTHNLPGYGIDWDEIDNTDILAHHNLQNRLSVAEQSDQSPFDLHHPRQFSHVEVSNVDCPLTDDQVSALIEYTDTLPPIASNTLEGCCELWNLALAKCHELVQASS